MGLDLTIRTQTDYLWSTVEYLATNVDEFMQQFIRPHIALMAGRLAVSVT